MRDTLKEPAGQGGAGGQAKDDTLRRKFTAHACARLSGRRAAGTRAECGVLSEPVRAVVRDRLLSVLPLETDVHYVLTL
jgi:hypothetical protein